MPKLRSASKRSTAATAYRSREIAESAIPLTMRAAAIDRYGGATQIDIRERPIPRPAAYEILIRIDCAGVGSWDASVRAGDVKTEHGFPLVLGTDGAGVVADVGSRVTRFKRGDRVYAYVFDNPKGGFYAEYVAVSAKHAGHVPKVLDLERAGALTVIGLTAFQGVDDVLKIQHGESLIVHGASGNVGMIAVQLAKWRGARVLATASGPRHESASTCGFVRTTPKPRPKRSIVSTARSSHRTWGCPSMERSLSGRRRRPTSSWSAGTFSGRSY